jgi:uncharacterized coiled-coil DUF342 family protein
MDRRKKNIAELENKKRESLRSLDFIMESLGSRLLERVGEAGFPSVTVTEYRRLQQEFHEAQDRIRTIEADYLRLQALDEEIESKEALQTARRRELSALYRERGKAILDDPQGIELPAFFRQQADFLVPKIDILEARLADMKTEETPTVFSWIGKTARTLAARSSLTKSQKELNRLCETLGEQFSHPGGAEAPAVKTGLLGKIQKLKDQALALAEELAELREKRRKIAADTGVRSGPLKRIRDLEKYIRRVKEEFAALYRQFGGEAAAGAKKQFASLLDEEDRRSLEKIALIRKTVRLYEDETEKLKASLAVDEAKEEIKKLETAIREQRNRIAAAETAISGYTQKIGSAQARIEELTKRME